MNVDAEGSTDEKTPRYTRVVEQRLDAQRLFAPLERVDPARTVYTPSPAPPGEPERAETDGER